MAKTKIKRIIHRCREEFFSTLRVAKVLTIRKAISVFRGKVKMQYLSHHGFNETAKDKNCLLKKHDIMLEYLEKVYDQFFLAYDYNKILIEDNDLNLHNKIWICWWQGIENAPEIVKVCVDSIKRNAQGCEIVIITEENYKQYSHLPDWVEEKKKKGIISATHYSDLLRLDLLARHGGIWIDATFFCIKPVVKEYLQLPLWSIKRPDYLHCSVAGGYFANYSLGCTYENRRAYVIIRDFLLKYWKDNNYIVDYLLTDYLIVLAQKYDKKTAELFNAIEPNNPLCDDLFKVLGEPYDEDVWNKFKESTCLFKLTWKQSFPLIKEGKETFYSKLLKQELS